uniref:MARVEL domain-containing protein n=1 Tax=Parastrongyloides trichosuri TaxID=131310 RepID=A0A0N5A4Q1_PARTI
MTKLFDKNDSFYYAPEVFGLVHYRVAAILGAILGITSLISVIICFFTFQNSYGITGYWSSAFVLLIGVTFVITTLLMIYGIISESPKFIYPQMAILQIETIILILIAIFSIFSMSCGISVTNYIFSFILNVEKAEKYLGPIWPFNISAITFVGALACVWFQVIVKGAHEYLLDKKYFEALEGPGNVMELKHNRLK